MKQKLFKQTWAYSHIFWPNRVYPYIFKHDQAYSDILKHIQNPVQPCYMKNQGHIQNPVNELRWIILWKQLTATIIYPNYNYCRNISFSRSELYERSTMVFFNTGLVFNLKVFSLMQKSMGPRGPRFGGCELWYTLKFR